MTAIISNRPVKVMLVDDSAIIRGIYRRIMEADTGIEIVATASNGQQAIEALERHDVDLVVLDIEMPVMDGLSAIPHLLKLRPTMTILMSSTLSARNAEVSLKALRAGAADCIQKPTSNGEMGGQQEFSESLLDKIKTLGSLSRKPPVGQGAAPGKPEEGGGAKTSQSGQIKFRARSKIKPSIVAIGSSTGGPKALIQVFGKMPSSMNVPIVVTQHMPPIFTKTLAEQIDASSDWVCHEAQDREELEPGKILIAPGGFHMTVQKVGMKVVARLNQEPPVNFCRPAVDPMFNSVAEAFGESTLAVVLTGMGSDGTSGGRAIADKGGTVLAQDEETSVVWGMPGAAAMAGVCSKLVALGDVAGEVEKHVRGVVV